MALDDSDARARDVLAHALASTSKATRLRAVSMLAHVDFPERLAWLEGALEDREEDVSATARAVIAWVLPVQDAPWPEREDPRFDRIGVARDAGDAPLEPPSRWQWEYVVEVWRQDGLLLGIYLATTCEEDDEHARRIALGQAILANAGGRGDDFRADTAATFIVGKRRLAQNSDGSGPPRMRRRRGA